MVGNSLADRSKPNESFSPHIAGIVLRIWYDTTYFIWSITKDKLGKICKHLVNVIANKEEVTVHQMLSLIGELVDIRALVEEDKYNLVHILASANSRMCNRVV